MSENKNSLSESKTSRSEGTVCKSESAGSAIQEAWLSFDDALFDFDFDLRSFFAALVVALLIFFSAKLVRTSTPVLGPVTCWLFVLDGNCPTLSAFLNFTVNLNGGLYKTCKRARSFRLLLLELFVVVVVVVPGAVVVVVVVVAPTPVDGFIDIVAAVVSLRVKLPALRDFEPVNLLNGVTCLCVVKNNKYLMKL